MSFAFNLCKGKRIRREQKALREQFWSSLSVGLERKLEEFRSVFWL